MNASRHRLVALLAPVFGLTGFCALALQVVWQRALSLHSGVDLASATTVVAAFLGGLGLGSLVGGRLADRLGPDRSLVAFAAANAGIGLFAWASLSLFYDFYRDLAPHLASPAASFAFNAAILVVPTTLMGLSTPLVARAVTVRVADAGRLVGLLYGINTVGAGVGAAVTGWFLLGELGFLATVRVIGALNIVAAVLVLLLRRLLVRTHEGLEPAGFRPERAAEPDRPAGVDAPGRVWPWLVSYGLTGAVALAFEQLFFRLIDAEMRSNSYSFAHVLTLYLLLFGGGAAIGARILRRGVDARRWYLWSQFGVGVTALAAVVVLVRVLPAMGFEDELARHFGGLGYATGFGETETLGQWVRLAVVLVVIPVGLMGLPVLFMGMSFPFVQTLVADRLDRLGRRTGTLLAANTTGNVAGTLLGGFFLIDRLGTAGTYRALAGVLVVAGVAAALLARRPSARAAQAIAAAAVLTALLAASPSNHRLWAFLHGVTADRLAVVEDHTCVSAYRFSPGESMLFINARSQNAHPFDDFHVLLGLFPTLVHPAPKDALVIGFGAGSTTFGMLADPRLNRVDTVELCEGQYELARRLADGGEADFRRLLADTRHVARVGDGRKHLLVDSHAYDIVTVDTLIPQSASSGSLYSQEFYKLVADQLRPDGVLGQWIPTPRVLNSVAQVFPYVVALNVEQQRSSFFLASKQPIPVEPRALLDRFAAVDATTFRAEQRSSLEKFLAGARVRCIVDGTVVTDTAEDLVNTDLRPRDEYFLNNDTSPLLPTPACDRPDQ